MPHQRRDFRDAFVASDAPILRAVEVIDSASLQIALVVDGEHRLVGTVTDGDVRRGLLRGIRLEEPVLKVMNAQPRSVPEGTGREAALRLLVEFDLHQMPVVDPQGRVVDLFMIDDMVRGEADDTWIVLMAGGLGTRLRPVTNTVPKPMIPVGGKPMIQGIVEAFSSQGFGRFWLSVNYMADVFVRHFGDGSRFGVRVDYLEETERKGTAGALSLLPEAPPGPVIVMNGDILTTVDFRQLLRFHRDRKAQATMCVREYSVQVPFGVAETDGYRLTSLQEKPVHSFFVNAGIYVLSPEAVARVPKGRAYDMTQLFTDLMAEGAQTAVFPLREYWLDIGRHEDLQQARDEFSGGLFDARAAAGK